MGSQPHRQCPKFTKRPDESQQKKINNNKKICIQGRKGGAGATKNSPRCWLNGWRCQAPFSAGSPPCAGGAAGASPRGAAETSPGLPPGARRGGLRLAPPTPSRPRRGLSQPGFVPGGSARSSPPPQSPAPAPPAPGPAALTGLPWMLGGGAPGSAPCCRPAPAPVATGRVASAAPRGQGAAGAPPRTAHGAAPTGPRPRHGAPRAPTRGTGAHPPCAHLRVDTDGSPGPKWGRSPREILNSCRLGEGGVTEKGGGGGLGPRRVWGVL